MPMNDERVAIYHKSVGDRGAPTMMCEKDEKH
jgi:hypothetical protein